MVPHTYDSHRCFARSRREANDGIMVPSQKWWKFAVV
jgi:hypothetical protein